MIYESMLTKLVILANRGTGTPSLLKEWNTATKMQGIRLQKYYIFKGPLFPRIITRVFWTRFFQNVKCAIS